MPPLSLQQQATNLTKTRLDTNNSTNALSNKLFSVLEAGEGSLYMRDFIDHRINEYANAHGMPAFQWDALRKLSSIKDKIAYLVGHDYETQHGGAAFDEALLDQRIQEITNSLEERLFARHDFSESRILRHAAYNTFETKLSVTERQALMKLAQRIKKTASDARAQIVAQAMDFQQESDAQKIIKIEEAVAMLTQAGITIDEDIVTGVQALSEKIEPLKTLDKSYKHMGQMHSMMHTLGKNACHSMIGESQREKLICVLQTLGKKPEDFIIAQNSSETLQDKLSVILHQSNRASLDNALKQHTVSRKEFEQWFLSYFGFYNIDQARSQLQEAKVKAFGHKVKRYEQDMNRWRGGARQRVMAVHAHMTPAGDFGNEEDYTLVSNYFDTFKSLFSADPEADLPAFEAMRRVVAALIRRRVPAIAHTQNLRPRFQRTLRGMNNNRGNVHHNAHDDAEIFATLIISQANTAQELYYDDQNPNVNAETRTQRFAKHVSRTEHYRQGVRRFVRPGLKGLLRLGENAVRHTGSLVGSIVAGTTKYGAKGLGSYNRWVEKKFHWGKLPFYALWPVSFAAEKLNNVVNRSSIGLMAGGQRLRKAGVNEIKNMSGDQQTTHLVDGIGKSLDTASGWVGKGTSWVGKKRYDNRIRNEQRRVLASFFDLASTDSNIANIMQSTALANMLNLKDYGPYLYDEDGRTQTIDLTPEATTENTPDTAVQALADTLQAQGAKIEQDISAEFKDIQTKYREATSSGDTAKIQEYTKLLRSIQPMHLKIRDVVSKMRVAANGVGNVFSPASQAAISRLIRSVGTIRTALGGDITRIQGEIAIQNRNIIAASTTKATQEALLGDATRRGGNRAAIPGIQTALNNATTNLSNAQAEKQKLESELHAIIKYEGYISYLHTEFTAIKGFTDIIPTATGAVVDDNAKALIEHLKNIDLSLQP